MARYIGPVCRLCRREGDEAVPQGRALLHGEVRDREAQLPAGTARQDAEGEARRLRPAAAREAEGQAHLWRARRPVPPLLRGGRADARHHRRDAAAAARAAARQRRLPARPGDVARRRRGSSCATATSWSTARRSTFRRTRSRPATSSASSARSAEEPDHRARDGRSEGPRHSRVALVRRRTRSRGRIVSMPTRAQINLPVQEQLIVELYSK